MQVKKQQLELEMEQQTGSKSGKEYGKAVCILSPSLFSLYVEYIMEKAMAPHSSIPAWRIPWTEEPSRLQSMGLLRVRYD